MLKTSRHSQVNDVIKQTVYCDEFFFNRALILGTNQSQILQIHYCFKPKRDLQSFTNYTLFQANLKLGLINRKSEVLITSDNKL